MTRVSSDSIPSVSGATAPCLDLLTASCTNDSNLLLLPSIGVLPAAVRLLAGQPQAKGGSGKGVAAAAVRLLSTAATVEDVRKGISTALGAASGAGFAGVMEVLQTADVATQVSTE